MLVFNIKKGHDKSDFESESFLQINCAGVEIASYQRFKGDCRICRAEGRYDWQIQLVTEGLIDLYDGGVQYSLKPGDCFIIPPNVPSDFIYRINNGKKSKPGILCPFHRNCRKRNDGEL